MNVIVNIRTLRGMPWVNQCDTCWTMQDDPQPGLSTWIQWVARHFRDDHGIDLLNGYPEEEPEPVNPGQAGTIWHLTPEDVEILADAFYWAAGEAHPVRLCIDGGIKIDVGDGNGWSRPRGKEERHGG